MEQQTQQYTLEKVGRYGFMAEPFHCDFNAQLMLGHLGNHMLNAADFHSSDRGFGMMYLNTIHKTWVLSRLAIEMERMPRAYERFDIETWVENAVRFFTNRNFAVVASDGTPYGYGRSVWAMIDTETRQPQNLFDIHDGSLLQYVEREKPCPINKGTRAPIPSHAEWMRSVATNYSDVDMNGHINSVKYIEHILDLWPLDWYKYHAVRRFDVAYVAEAHAGDVLHFFGSTVDNATFAIRVTRTSGNQSRDEGIEVCRCHVSFVDHES